MYIRCILSWIWGQEENTLSSHDIFCYLFLFGIADCWLLFIVMHTSEMHSFILYLYYWSACLALASPVQPALPHFCHPILSSLRPCRPSSLVSVEAAEKLLTNANFLKCGVSEIWHFFIATQRAQKKNDKLPWFSCLSLCEWANHAGWITPF